MSHLKFTTKNIAAFNAFNFTGVAGIMSWIQKQLLSSVANFPKRGANLNGLAVGRTDGERYTDMIAIGHGMNIDIVQVYFYNNY